MTDLPAAALEAAAQAMADACEYSDAWYDFDGLAQRALEAAAPHITAAAAAAERDRIIALIEAEEGRLRRFDEAQTHIAAGALSDIADLIVGTAP